MQSLVGLDFGDNEESAAAARSNIQVPVLLNLAACALHTRRYARCVVLADAAIGKRNLSYEHACMGAPLLRLVRCVWKQTQRTTTTRGIRTGPGRLESPLPQGSRAARARGARRCAGGAARGGRGGRRGAGPAGGAAGTQKTAGDRGERKSGALEAEGEHRRSLG